MLKLTEKEKIVLHGLVRWPELNDLELSDRIDIKRPTVTAIRNKFEKEGVYKTIRVPAFDKIGCEIISVKYGEFNPLTPYEIRRKYSGWSKFPESVFWIASDTGRVGVDVGENYTEIKKHIDYSERTYGEHGFHTDKGNIYHLFPLRLSKIYAYLDFAPLLSNIFDLGNNVNINIDVDLGGTPEKFNKNEKLVMYALVKYPTLKDNEIAEKLDLTRQSVNNIRKRFETQKLVKTVRVPDINKLGLELLVFMHIRAKPHASLDVRKDGILEELKQGSQIIYLAGNLESVIISSFRNYTDFQRTYDHIVSFYREHDFLFLEPTIKIFPIKDLKLFVYDRYTPLVKKVFGIEKEI
jgi:DNA-binding MarR family transcriptional regulator